MGSAHSPHEAVTKRSARNRDEQERLRHERVNAIWIWLTFAAIIALVALLTILGGASNTTDSYYFLP